uniref:Uncharacterized protein n=1 Tax=Anopheles epiroticus TaxID=199890 RepID=A0A182PI96_9DIPT
MKPLEALKSKLSNETEEEFIQAYEKHCKKNEGRLVSESECGELLSLAVILSKHKAALKLVEEQLVEGKLVCNLSILSGLLAKCCLQANVPMLTWLLEILPNTHEAASLINEEPWLTLLVKHIDVYKEKKCPFFNAMQVLLDDPRIEVDKIDAAKCTALQYAAKYKIGHAQELLLAKGAYIGGVDSWGNLLISEIDPLLLETHLDSCITTNSRLPGDEDYEIRINFSNFMPPASRAGKGRGKSTGEQEMQPIVQLTQLPSTKQLLWHPVVSSMLMLKWMKLICGFFINLLISFVFAVSFTTYIVLCYAQEESILKQVLYYVSILGWVYLTGREFIQFVLNTRMYVQSMENVMEVLLIVGSSAVLLYESTDEAWLVVLIGVLLLLAIELTLQIGMLPVNSIYTNMVMLKTVTKNFLKCLSFFSFILLSFALSFYTLYRLGQAPDTPANDEHSFNNFHDVPLALVKTVVMFTGEFEAANIEFKVSWPMYILFPFFVFFVTIVINNLMNGLAVSDTAAIQTESEVVGISEMVYIICRYDKALEAINAYRCIHFLRRSQRLNWLFPNLQLFCNKEPLQEIVLKPEKSHTIECKTVSLAGRTVNSVENGAAEYAMKSNSDRLELLREYSTKSIWNLPFKGMLEKITQKSNQILLQRRGHVGSVENRFPHVEQNIENISQELVQLRTMIERLSS